MIDRIRRGRQPYVCLDFGRDQLTAIEVLDGEVVRWAARPLHEDVLRNGDVVVPAALGDTVRQLLGRSGILARSARLALPDDATVSRHIVMPPMPHRDLVRAMHYTAERHIPFSIDRARWAWDVVERNREGTLIYLVATWRDVVDRFAATARAAGLVPEVLEPRALAVARAVGQEQALLVDAGASRLHAMLLVRGHPAFVDEVAVGSDFIDRREALDRLVQRAYRYQSTATGAVKRLAPVLLAGDLELSSLELPVGGRPVGEVLNGHLPVVPPGFRPGGFLANLGLCMRGRP